MGIIFRYFSKIDVIIMGSVISLFDNGYGGESGREIRGQKIKKMRGKSEKREG